MGDKKSLHIWDTLHWAEEKFILICGWKAKLRKSHISVGDGVPFVVEKGFVEIQLTVNEASSVIEPIL